MKILQRLAHQLQFMDGALHPLTYAVAALLTFPSSNFSMKTSVSHYDSLCDIYIPAKYVLLLNVINMFMDR